MEKKCRLSLFFIILISAGCQRTDNFKDVTIGKTNGKISIKLIGKRKLMSHSPNDLVEDNTYTDSLVIYTPTLKEGKITDIEIPVPEGNYKFQGSLFNKGNKLIVTIFIVDTTQKKLIPSDWNGTYDLPH
jgi:hypothetical protein